MPPSTEAQARRRLELVAEAFALTVACPYDQDNPSDCQLCRVRPLARWDRWAWVQARADAELEQFIDRHRRCLDRKENGPGA